MLKEAEKIICGDRDKSYGSPENSFQKIAELWSVYLERNISAHDVGMMMALLKVARIRTGIYKEDSYIDCAGYIACAAEIEERERRWDSKEC